jgi:hypothetical protein
MRVLAGFTLRDFWEVKPPAQTNDERAAEFVITVPFKFVVGAHTLPPATYRFEVLPALTSRVWLLAVRGQNGQAIKLHVDRSQPASHRPFRWKLIFDRREHLHFLTEVWLAEGRLSLHQYRSLQDSDPGEKRVRTEVILLAHADYHGNSVYVAEDFG